MDFYWDKKNIFNLNAIRFLTMEANREKKFVFISSKYFLGGDAVPTILSKNEPKQHDARSWPIGGTGSRSRRATASQTVSRWQPTIFRYFGKTGKLISSDNVDHLCRHLRR